MMNRENVNTADNSGDENDENSNAKAQMIKNCKTMKYTATRIWASDASNL